MVFYNINNLDSRCYSFIFNDSFPGEMVFHVDEVPCFLSTGIRLGILEESNGIEELCRLHERDKMGWFWVETVSKHPFGSEPILKHRYEQAGNHIRVISDIRLYGDMLIDEMVIDRLRFVDNWDSITLFFIDKYSMSIEEVSYDLKDGIELIYRDLPIIFILRRDGLELEIGSGDIWRWDRELPYGDRIYKIAFLDGNLEYIRIPILKKKEDILLKQREFRYSWYFAWSSLRDHSVESKKIIENRKINRFSLEDSFADIIGSGYKKYSLNISSRRFKNLFKNWFRKLIYKVNNNSDIIISDFPLLTSLDIDKKNNYGEIEKFSFDYPYLLGLWEWTNKIGADRGIKVYFDLGPLSNLPSAKGMIYF